MKHLINTITIIGILGITAGALSAQTVNVPRIINENTTWTSDNVYVLQDYTFVVTPDGASEPTVLTIEPGTVVVGQTTEFGDSGEAATLVITRGAQIDAQGTSTNPIIFTSILDDPVGAGTDAQIGLWGGVIILGDASINSRADGEPAGDPAQDQIEGMSVEESEIDFVTFGGTNDDDNSGTMRYVSIRHGGSVLGTSNEINGLTMGGVGRGTTIEFIEVFANKDDGYEWFGGTVNAKYLVSSFNNDESFDFDQGWRGNGQFWFGIGKDVGTDRNDNGSEIDGATSPIDATPLANTVVYNATYIGIGDNDGVVPPESGEIRTNNALRIRDNAGVQFWNSIFTDFATMLRLETDQLARADDVASKGSVFWSHTGNNTVADLIAPTDAELVARATAILEDETNTIADPMLIEVSRTAGSMSLDPRPSVEGPALFSVQPLPADSEFFEPAAYRGAFDPNGPLWIKGWTKLDEAGYLTDAGAPSAPPANQLLSISTRGFLETGNTPGVGFNFLNAGFIIEGSEPMDVVIRGRAQSLDLPEGTVKAADPIVDVVRIGEGVIATNDNYTLAENIDMLTGTDLDPTTVGMDTTEAALVLLNLAPGAYTARLSVSGDTAGGVAIVEVISVE